ncbi:MAG: ribosome-binding factor A [Bdellovibrionales bacterium]|nr:ribosome-binding factor A [Bdellovibrionales bacterium]
MTHRRCLKIAREIREALAFYFLSGKTPFPPMVSVWHVDVSENLRSAKVFIKVSDPEDLELVEELIQQEKRRMQNQIASHLRIKFCPSLRFVVGGSDDPSFFQSEEESKP